MSHNGMASIKFIASQARTIFQYKNIRIPAETCRQEQNKVALVTSIVVYWRKYFKLRH